MFEYGYMQNAFWAIMIITPLFGLVGTMIVNNKLAFFSDALGHSALTGIAIGALLGISNPTISMVIFGILFALLLNRIKDLKITSRDTIISVFSSTALALGLVILSYNGNFNKFSSYLIGDILSIVPEEIFLLLGIAVIVLCFWYFFFNKLFAISINSSLAKSKGINVRLIEDIFIVLVALIVMISIRWVGILIINLFKSFELFNYKTILLAILLCFLYACSDEIHQLFIKGRSCEVRDILIDTIGSLSGISVYYLFSKISIRKTN